MLYALRDLSFVKAPTLSDHLAVRGDRETTGGIKS